jgi:hypothetical protein
VPESDTDLWARVSARVGSLVRTLGEEEDDFLALHSQLAYLLNARMSVGVGHTFFDFDVERNRGTRREYYDLDLQGPRVFFNVAF